jgi:hypothetical protein
MSAIMRTVSHIENATATMANAVGGIGMCERLQGAIASRQSGYSPLLPIWGLGDAAMM